MSASYPVPTEDLLAEWEAEVAHTTIDEIEHVAKRAAEWGWRQCAMEGLREASTALAQPEPEVAGPSDEELADTYWDAWHKYLDRTNSVLHAVGLRAVLARWGRPAPAPAGEVGEFADALRDRAARLRAVGLDATAGEVEHAVDLLERQAAPVPVLPEDAQVIEPSEHTILVPAPVPVAVADRIPRAEDCDAEGRCWWFDGEIWSPDIYDHEYTHWLPFNALPLPSGEVEHG